LSSGIGYNENNPVIINYDITGRGDYNYLYIFITGFDSQKLKCAEESSTIVLIKYLLDKNSNLWFAFSYACLFYFDCVNLRKKY
jgi:hypothetical protein